MVAKKISNSSWKKLLLASLNKAARKADPRVSFLGIGNVLNGDDAAGVWLARRLISLIPQSDKLLILNCGQVPENAVGALRRFKPNLVILLDAADFGGLPGEIRWIDPQDTSGFSASSHSLPFSVLSGYLTREFKCDVGLLGIQPSSLDFDAGLSSPVKNSIAEMLQYLVETLSNLIDN
jgi:hydrogenase 3 maturation protease